MAGSDVTFATGRCGSSQMSGIASHQPSWKRTLANGSNGSNSPSKADGHLAGTRQLETVAASLWPSQSGRYRFFLTHLLALPPVDNAFTLAFLFGLVAFVHRCG